jgi:hypothetical protein
MDKRTMILVVTLFALIVGGMFLYAYLKRTEITQNPVVVEEEEVNIPYALVETIDAKHYYIDGVHTFVGEVVLPTPCDLLEVDTIVMESYPEQVRLDFTVINNSEVCAQVLTTQRFKAEAKASSEAKITATFMGRNIPLNLIPAAEGETPDEFELFIKG